MNFILTLILCSGIDGMCIPMYEEKKPFKDFYDCILSGSFKSIIELENIGRETVNDNKLYIKFGCNEVTKS
jgi:hypothetical protein|tara:strand:- start:214 stop:426 length:213 start_codon:yes stop_codon:yes gene_type:complete